MSIHLAFKREKKGFAKAPGLFVAGLNGRLVDV